MLKWGVSIFGSSNKEFHYSIAGNRYHVHLIIAIIFLKSFLLTCYINTRQVSYE